MERPERPEPPAQSARRRRPHVADLVAQQSADAPIEPSRRPNALEVLERSRDALTVRRVFGDPIERDGVTVIPAASVRGGAGGGGDTQGNGGGGFGISATPAGAFVIKDGTVRWRPAVNVNRIVFWGQIVVIVALLVLRSIAKRRRA